jgi:hypothetical protein
MVIGNGIRRPLFINNSPNISQYLVRTEFSKGHKQKSPAQSAGLFIWMRGKLAFKSENNQFN